MRLNVNEAVDRIVRVLPERRPIEHHEPQIDGRESSHLAACFAKGLTGYDYIKLMEDRLRSTTGATQALVVSSGTAALHLALMAVGVKPGDEVLVPSLTFVATANAVVQAGAVPNFVDGSININPYKLHCYLARETIKKDGKRVNRKTERPVTALIVVDLLGIPANMLRLGEVAAEFGLTLIEDASEALGSKIDNTSCGNFGAVATLSFNNNKIVTTGGGGALLTNDEWILAAAYRLATTARVPHPWLVEHDAVAWNYRMPNICAAIGVAQLEQLNNFLTKKRILSQRYQRMLSDCPGLRFVEQPEGANCWLNAVLVDDKGDRDKFLGALHERKIMARAVFTPLHKLPMYKDNPRDGMGYCEDTAARMVCLPSGAGLAS